MVQWYREYTQVHMVKWLYSPSSDVSFTDLSDDGYQPHFLTPSDSASIVSASVVSGGCLVYCINPHDPPQRPLMPYTPSVFDLFNSPLPLLCHLQNQGGSYHLATSSFLLFLDVPLLAIYYIISVLL